MTTTKISTQLSKYWGYLANNVVFIQISTDVSSALKIFETINERGVGLNPMDLLKNLLFTHVRPDEFTRLKDEWKKITKPLEEAQGKAAALPALLSDGELRSRTSATTPSCAKTRSTTG